jgi:hypothetical protein
LVLSKNKRRFAGVRIGKVIESADLVVDATGRGTRSPHWLEEIGYPPPPQEKVEIDFAIRRASFDGVPVT